MNRAVNLRAARGGGLRPVGVPQLAAADAGSRCASLGDGHLLTVDDDLRGINIDGRPAGVLAHDYAAVMPDGDGALIFTAGGVEWLAGGELRGGVPDVDVSYLAEPGQGLQEQMLMPAPEGTYPRSEGVLTAADRQSASATLAEVMEMLTSRAALTGRAVQPLLVSWRLVDTAGRTVARGIPSPVGRGVQMSDPLTFAASHSGNKLEVTGSAQIKATEWALHLKIAREASDFWRSRVGRLDLLVAPLPGLFTGVAATFGASGSQSCSLTLTPAFDLDGATARARSTFARKAVVAASVSKPLDGFDATLSLDFEGPGAGDDAEFSTLPVVENAWRFGSLTVYASAAEPGVIVTAPSARPLQAVAATKVSRGRIRAITQPVGSGGGWNYGRHHLMVFAADGVYAVSIDRTLVTITSTLLHALPVNRPDAMTVTPSALYLASGGSLLRLRGARAEPVDVPFTVMALCYVAPSAELWMLCTDGSLAVMDRRGGLSRRIDISISRFVADALAVDSANAVRALDREGAEAVSVEWRRAVDCPAHGLRRCSWRLESAMVAGLRLTLLADSGGAPQRVVQLTVDGTVNAPVEAVCALPRRLRLGARLSGVMAHSSRLHSLTLS